MADTVRSTTMICPDQCELQNLIEEKLAEPRQSQVASHLAMCTDCRAMLETITENPLVASSDDDRSEGSEFLQRLRELPPPEDASDDELIDLLSPPRDKGELGRLGEYAILDVLGRGGMGVVLRGRDERLDRDVAIKIMRPSLSGKARYRTRFLREARSVAAIDHPHVVPVYHVGQHNGLPFMVMKCLQGQTLADRLKQHGCLAEPELRRLAMQAAAGLVAAHRSGTIHRDIKPENIWLENPDDTVRLLDFGLVCPGDSVRLTADGAVLGTPAYMSPEQADGNADERSDFFSLGAVLYEAASNKMPFPGDTVVEVLAAVANRSPIELWQDASHVSRSFSDVVMRLLRKNPDQRPADAAEVIQMIEAVPEEQTLPQGDACSGGSLWTANSLILGGLLACAIALGVIVMRMRTPTGTIVVELADGVPADAIVIRATSDGYATLIDKDDGWAIDIAPGRYTIAVAGGLDQFAIDKDSVTVERNAAQRVRVFRHRSDVASKMPAADPGVPALAAKSSGSIHSKVADRIEDQSAFMRWALAAGGKIQLLRDDLLITHPNQIPDRLEKIQTVEFTDTKIVDADIDQFAKLRHAHRVIFGAGDTESSRLTEEAIARLVRLENFQFRELHLRRCNATGRWLKHLQGMSHLTGLAIYNGRIADEDLSVLQTLPSLRHITLWECGIAGDGLQYASACPIDLVTLYGRTLDGEALARLPAWPGLRSLTLNAPSKSSVSDATLLSLARYKKLEELKLSQLPMVTPKGLSVLAELPELHSLQLAAIRSLDEPTFQKTIDSLRGLQHISLRLYDSLDENALYLRNAKRLKSIDFGSGTRFRPSAEVIDQLQKALPECKIK